MSKIYTKRGDKGTTQLLSGDKVPKYHYRVEAYGSIDELTSYIGLLRSSDLKAEIKSELLEIQQILFDISGLLACNKGKHLKLLRSIKNEQIEFLEKSIDKMTNEIGELKHFIIPGGQKEVAYAHICRVTARNAERKIVYLADKENIEQNIIIYINRLSDYFFTLSRYIAKLKNYEQAIAK
jgi:cob(I)alamin adenosyltransferase